MLQPATKGENMNVMDTEGARDSESLCLTLNRPFQQARHNRTKHNLRGKRFQIRANKSAFCRAHSIAFIRKENEQTIVRFDRIPCNSWTCPACVMSKAIKVKNLLRGVAIMNNLQYFLTLTLSPDQVPKEYLPEGDNLTHKYITKLFNTLLTNIRRQIKKDMGEQERLKYLWVIQFQKNGNAHIHVLLSTRLDIVSVRAIWERIGGGRQMYIEKVKNIDSAAAYISQYLILGIKDCSTHSWFHYFERRYSISKYCIRPIYSAKPMFTKSDTYFDRLFALKKVGQGWLLDVLESDFENGKEVIL